MRAARASPFGRGAVADLAPGHQAHGRSEIIRFMKRASGVFFVPRYSACAARAQDPRHRCRADLAALEQTAQKRHAEWEALAKDMNDRMARILPCDPRALAAVTEVSRASEARLAALADYLRAVSAQGLRRDRGRQDPARCRRKARRGSRPGAGRRRPGTNRRGHAVRRPGAERQTAHVAGGSAETSGSKSRP